MTSSLPFTRPSAPLCPVLSSIPHTFLRSIPSCKAARRSRPDAFLTDVLLILVASSLPGLSRSGTYALAGDLIAWGSASQEPFPPYPCVRLNGNCRVDNSSLPLSCHYMHPLYHIKPSLIVRLSGFELFGSARRFGASPCVNKFSSLGDMPVI
ncbi:hypothetical protein PHLGIDRAFT_383146 [Phlebiopsis gigantea 11061_1 CR5-6]|uniref:Uncharacterized protein n=1 Tax=Phlebiopsis gigantea (strain 11061_1 CR5-6) TaxID=745531 RepID=A0A0C3PNG6_PHLG1|nr:hypothetical protein PHLGIDRAFT_383146 [Phlebiopsis gigantea 11061_1 CR5-6]